MQIQTFLANYTGLTVDALFNGPNGSLVELRLPLDGEWTFPVWRVEGKNPPTAAQVKAALNKPDPAPDMAPLRQAAFESAMAYGNGITARVTGAYSDVEARTWPLQRAQADTVLGGGELPPDALLLKLAERRGMAVPAFALLVQAKAQQFEAIADVGQGLRLGAEGLLSPDLDTPAKLDAAVAALREQALTAAAQLGLAA